MDWIRTNTFLATFGGIMLAGVLGLGFFAFSAWRGDAAAIDTFNSTRADLERLETSSLHPDPENLERVKTDVDAYEKSVAALFSKLEAAQKPLPASVDPTQFGGKILAELEPFLAKATENRVILGDNFYMGMDHYRTNQVQDEAVQKRLEWTLGGIATLADIAIESGIDAIDKFERYRYAWEDPSLKPPEPKVTKKKRNSRKSTSKAGGSSTPAGSMADVTEESRVRMRITGSPESITKFFNLISNNKDYFYWIRWAKIGNEKPKGPSRVQTFSPTPVDQDVGQDVAGDEAERDEAEDAPPVIDEGDEQPPAMIDVFPILGTEDARADLIIDIVRFREPAGADDDKKDDK